MSSTCKNTPAEFFCGPQPAGALDAFSLRFELSTDPRPRARLACATAAKAVVATNYTVEEVEAEAAILSSASLANTWFG